MIARCGLIVGANYRAQAERQMIAGNPREAADALLEDPFAMDVVRRVAAQADPKPLQVVVAEEHGGLFLFPVILKAEITAVVG